MAREQVGEHRDEFGRQHALFHIGRAEVHRPGQVEQEPGGDLSILLKLAHMRHLQARGDVPVDVAHVVVRLVLAQVGKVDAKAPEQRAVIALQQAVQAPDHGPFEAAQDTLGVDAARRGRSV